MATTDVTEGSVRSADGTTIAFERSGAGPVVILVDGASCYRELGPMRPVAGLLAADFTVFAYDRRGRGESTDTLPYAVEREIEDLAALITEAGGPVSLYGVSSGALLAMQAAAGGLAIRKLALFEPPIGSDEDRAENVAFTEELAELIAADRRWDAVERFLTSIGVPPEVMAQMGPVKPAFEAIAHTLLYDCEISNETTFDVVRSVTVPTLVIGSSASTDDLAGWAAAVVDALPDGTHRSLGGDWHDVPEEDVAETVAAFFR